jgi:hypothetical protein
MRGLPRMANPRRTPPFLYLLWGTIGTTWLVAMLAGDRFGLFRDGWFMSVTMLVGSFIAGATSEGGGAVAFPVMTLGYGIAPPVARDFALLIQSAWARPR